VLSADRLGGRRERGRVYDLEVAVSDYVGPSKLRKTLSAAEMNLGPELQRDFAHSLLRASFVALTAGMFFVWLATSN